MAIYSKHVRFGACPTRNHTSKCLVDTTTGEHTLPAQLSRIKGDTTNEREIVTVYMNGIAYKIRVDTAQWAKFGHQVDMMSCDIT